VVRFCLTHYEHIPGKGTPFEITSIDPDKWWSQVVMGEIGEKSQQHMEARIKVWQEAAIQKFGEKK
jgi:hypothetical protein